VDSVFIVVQAAAVCHRLSPGNELGLRAAKVDKTNKEGGGDYAPEQPNQERRYCSIDLCLSGDVRGNA
jgi:hypothetical protein